MIFRHANFELPHIARPDLLEKFKWCFVTALGLSGFRPATFDESWQYLGQLGICSDSGRPQGFFVLDTLSVQSRGQICGQLVRQAYHRVEYDKNAKAWQVFWGVSDIIFPEYRFYTCGRGSHFENLEGGRVIPTLIVPLR